MGGNRSRNGGYHTTGNEQRSEVTSSKSLKKENQSRLSTGGTAKKNRYQNTDPGMKK